MATQNLTRFKTNSLSKRERIFYAEFDYSDVLTSADVYQLMKFPKEVIITRASINVITAFNSATSASGVLGLDSGNGLKTASDLKSTAGTNLDAGNIAVRAPTGGVLAFTPTYVGAPTAGRIGILVKYLEYTRADGDLTSFV